MLTNKSENKTFFGTEKPQYKDHFCTQCKKEIPKNENIIQVVKTDGFKRQFVGYVCSEKCFKNLK